MRGFGIHKLLVALVGLCAAAGAVAQVLPEDRADALYHSYEGDQVEITGPSFLVRKQVSGDVSLYANYYVDKISSASIDVRSYASPYSERRNEYGLGGDVILGEAIVSAGYSNSDEPDFEANTAYLGISQEVFGGLTTVRLSFARGWDTVGNVQDPTFSEDVDRRIYRLGLSQVMTRNLVMSFDFEGISDEGFLNNPYRQVRYEAAVPEGFLWQPEVYPNTRDSSAFSVGARYFVESRRRSSIYGHARYFSDSWDISAYDVQMGYTMALVENWIFDVSYRYYTQTAAEFFSDLFPFQDAQNFLARDKELSSFQDHTIRGLLTYDFLGGNWGPVSRGTANLDLAYIYFDYDDFRNVPVGGPVGEEPLFNFGALIAQVYVSFWF